MVRLVTLGLLLAVTGCSSHRLPYWPEARSVPDPCTVSVLDPNDPEQPLGIFQRPFTVVLSSDQFQVGQCLTTRQPNCPLLQIISRYGNRSQHWYGVTLFSNHPLQQLPHRYLKPGVCWYRYIPKT